MDDWAAINLVLGVGMALFRRLPLVVFAAAVAARLLGVGRWRSGPVTLSRWRGGPVAFSRWRGGPAALVRLLGGAVALGQVVRGALAVGVFLFPCFSLFQCLALGDGGALTGSRGALEVTLVAEGHASEVL